jgi:hypothetical protein
LDDLKGEKCGHCEHGYLYPFPSCFLSVVLPLKVTAEDELKKSFSECLVAELQKDPGVKVGEAREALTFDVIVIKQKMSNGELLGFLLYLGGYLPGPLNAGEPASKESQTVLIYWQTLRMAPPDLATACRRAARDYQGEVIEPVRSTLKQFSDSLERQGRPSK